MENRKEQIAVVPAGAFGTAMGILAARNGHEVSLYIPRRETLRVITDSRQNPRLPGVDLPESMLLTNNLSEALEGRSVVVFAAPSHLAKRFGGQIAEIGNKDAKIFLSLTKGFYVSSQNEVSVVTQMLQSLNPDIQTAAESGPNFAPIVASGERQVKTVIASRNNTRYMHKAIFSTEKFEIELDTDEIATQVAGATKNVYAFVVGMCEGAGVDPDILAKLVDHGPSEMAEVSAFLGAEGKECHPVAGIGDLRLTCTKGSRNYRAGIRIGEGKVDPAELVKEAVIADEVVESVHAAWAVKLLSEKAENEGRDLEIPVMRAGIDVLYNGRPVREVVQKILKTRSSAVGVH